MMDGTREINSVHGRTDRLHANVTQDIIMALTIPSTQICPTSIHLVTFSYQILCDGIEFMGDAIQTPM